jgi:hypothetical protein
MEDKIEVNEYVRTERGIIFKTTESFKNNDENVPKKYNHLIDKIVKHSKDIIDLIQENDYVNGKKVYSIGTALGNIPTINFNDGTFAMEVKTIVTHQQFSQIEYKVEE